MITRIPYFETSRYKVATMVELSQVEKHSLVADLGSGDGRISIAFGGKGAQVTGFELNDGFIEKSEKLIDSLSLENNITIQKKNFWNVNLNSFDIICIYPMPDIMDLLEIKLLNELRPKTKVITNYYKFPNWKHKEEKNNIYLYVR